MTNMNKRLDSTINNFENYFKKTSKPVVCEAGCSDGVELAQRIYKGNALWFWNNSDIVFVEPDSKRAQAIRKKYPEAKVTKVYPDGDVDIMKTSGLGALVGLRSRVKKIKMIFINVQTLDNKDARDFMHNYGWTLVDESKQGSSDTIDQVWLNSNLAGRD
jgi:hypothetical protein